MRLDDQRESGNIEDQRGRGGGFGGGGGGLRLGGGKMGIGSIIVIGILALVFGINPLTLLGGGGGGGDPVGQPQVAPVGQTPSAAGDESGRFVRRVLATTEDSWSKLLPAQVGQQYRTPTLVLFDGSVRSACGSATAASGPFYCPGDQKVYLDTSFFDELSRRFGAPGDFAAAYVIAHEVGHHIQTQLGISDEVRRAQSRASERESNAIQVRMELQADCLAGIWAKDNAALLEPGDVEEAVAAASAIGDDRLQRQSQGMVVPDSFTHGSSEQRVRWLKTGLQTGQVASCDTFAAKGL